MTERFKKKPKLLYILHCYFNRAGVEDHVKNLATRLTEDFEISILFPEKSYLWLFRANGELSIFAGDQPVWPATPYKLDQINESLRQILKEVAPDLIHVQHLMHWPLSLIDQIAETQIPLIVSLHDYYAISPHFLLEGVKSGTECFSPEYAIQYFKSDISSYLQERRAILTKSFSKLKWILTPSKSSAQTLNEVFPHTYKVIEHGIAEFKPIKKTFSQAEIRFGFLGTMVPQKGWEILLEAFNAFRETVPSAELHFFGGKKVTQNPWANVFFHGMYGASDLPRITSLFDVGVLPSTVPETYSLVLSELWMGKIPVAAAAIGALKDRVIDGENGKLFKPKDSKDLLTVLKWFDEHDEWKNWNLPKPRTAEEMAKDYQTLYFDVLSEDSHKSKIKV